VGFTIISISSSLIAVFIPIFFMPGVIGLLFHEFAVIVALSIVASAFVSLTLVPMMASRFLTDEAHKKPPGALVRFFERGFDAHAGAVHAHARRRAAPRKMGAAAWPRPPSWPPAGCSTSSPRASSRRRTSARSRSASEAAEDVSFEQMVQLQDRVAAIFRADPGGGHGQLVQRRQRRAEHRPHVHQPEAAQRTPADEAGGRRPAQASCARCPASTSSCGRCRTCSSAAASKAQYQYILQSVRADELNDWAVKLQERLRADPMFRDVTSDAQLRGLQAQLKIDRDRANTLGVSIEGALGAVQRLRRTPGVDHLPAHRQLPGHHGSDGPRPSATRAPGGVYVRSPAPARWCRCPALPPCSAPSGPTAINHVGQLQAVTVSFNLAPGVALGDATARSRRRASCACRPR
jgi:HAE1 family hydrophobic/amphiphilic exporter-1